MESVVSVVGQEMIRRPIESEPCICNPVGNSSHQCSKIGGVVLQKEMQCIVEPFNQS